MDVTCFPVRRTRFALLVVSLVVISVAVPVSGATGAGADRTAVEIDECRELNSPDTWILTQDIRNSGADACFLVTASDVTLDLNGHVVIGSETAGDAAVEIAPGVENVEIKNGDLWDWGDAVIVDGADDVTLRSLDVENIVADGITVRNVNGLTVDDVTIDGAGAFGVNLTSVRSARITATPISNTANGGVRIDDGTAITLDAVSVDGVDAAAPGTGLKNPGVAVVGSQNVTLRNASLSNTGMAVGIRSSSAVTVESTTITGARIRGVDGGAVTEFVLSDTSVDASREGVGLVGFDAVAVANLTMSGLSETGIHVEAGDGLELTELTASNVGGTDVSLAAVTNGSVTTLTVDEDGGDDTLVVDESASIIVDDARLEPAGNGIVVTDSGGVIVRDSNVSGAVRGVVLDGAPDVTVRNVTVSASTTAGISMTNADRVRVLDTRITPRSSTGVEVAASETPAIRNLTVVGGGTALAFEAGQDATVSGLTIRAVDTGVRVTKTRGVELSDAAISASGTLVESTGTDVVIRSLVVGDDLLSLRGDAFSISTADAPEPISGQQIAGPALAVAGVGDTPLQVTIPYSEAGVAEGTVRLWQSADGWSALSSSRDVDANRVTGKVSGDGIVVPLGEPAEETPTPTPADSTADGTSAGSATRTGTATLDAATPEPTATPAPGLGVGVALAALLAVLSIASRRW